MPTLTITTQLRNQLRAAAHALKPVVLIGDNGLTEAVLKEINLHLNVHQLIKIRVAGDDRAARTAMYEQICAELHAEPIHHIGKILTIYRENPERPSVLNDGTMDTRAVRSSNEPYTPKKLAAAGFKKTKSGKKVRVRR